MQLRWSGIVNKSAVLTEHKFRKADFIGVVLFAGHLIVESRHDFSTLVYSRRTVVYRQDEVAIIKRLFDGGFFFSFAGPVVTRRRALATISAF